MRAPGTSSRRSFLFLILLLAPFAAGGAAASPCLPIRGRVLIAGTDSLPVPGARILARVPEIGFADSAACDSSGRFELAGLPCGPVALHSLAPGFLSDGTWPSASGLGASGAPVILWMQRGGVVAGQVLDEDGHPLPGVTAEAIPGTRDDARALTGKDGRFQMEGLAAGAHWLRLTDGLHCFRTRRIQVSVPGSLTNLGAIRADPGRSVRGRVVDSDSNPLAGATVSYDAVGSASTRTDAKGEYFLRGLCFEHGAAITVTRTGFLRESRPLPDDTSGTATVDVRLTPIRPGLQQPVLRRLDGATDEVSEGESLGVRVWLPAPGAGELRVSDSQGRILLRRQCKSDLPQLLDGCSLRLPPLPGGSYSAVVVAGSASSQAMTFRVSDIALVDDARPGRRVVRAVRLDDGTGVPGIPIAVLGGAELGTTDSSGCIEVRDLTAATLLSADPAHPAWIRVRAPRPARTELRLLLITDREQVLGRGPLRFKLIARTDRDGEVIPPGTLPVHAALRYCRSQCPDCEAEVAGTLDASGEWTDSLTMDRACAPGRAELRVECEGNRALRTLQVSDGTAPALRLEALPPDAPLVPGDTAVVRVRATRADGGAASGIAVSGGTEPTPAMAIPERLDFGVPGGLSLDALPASTDSSGLATVRVPLPATFLASSPCCIRLVAVAGRDSARATAQLEVRVSRAGIPGIWTPGARAGLPAGAELRVRDAAGRAVPGGGVRVELWRGPGGQGSAAGRFLEAAEVSADSNGRAWWQGRMALEPDSSYVLRAVEFDDRGSPTVATMPLHSTGDPAAGQAGENSASLQVAPMLDTLDSVPDTAWFEIDSARRGVLRAMVAGRDSVTRLPDVRVEPGRTRLGIPGALFGAGGLTLALTGAWDGRPRTEVAREFLRRPDRRIRLQLKCSAVRVPAGGEFEIDLVASTSTGPLRDAGIALTGGPLLRVPPLTAGTPGALAVFYPPRSEPLAADPGRGGEEPGRATPLDPNSPPPRPSSTVIWAPSLRTDAAGHARLRVRAGDFLGPWQIHALVLGPNTAVGEATGEFEVLAAARAKTAGAAPVPAPPR